MTNDVTVVKDEASEGVESKDAAPEKVAEPTMAEQIASGVAKAMESAMPRLKQSIHDTVKSEASRAQPQEGVSAIRDALKGFDPDGGQTVDQFLVGAEEKLELKGFKDRDAQVQAAQQQAEEGKRVYDTLLRKMKIDPNNPALDWAVDATDRDAGEARLFASVQKILSTPVVDEQKVAAEAKAKERAASGVDFVDTSQTAGGSTSFSIPTKKEDFGPWLDKLPFSVYKEHKAEIEAAHNSGQMK